MEKVAGKGIIKELTQRISSKRKNWVLLDLFVPLNQIAENNPQILKEKK